MPDPLTQPAPKPPLYLVDASIYVFRAWHSMPNEFHDADGWPTNAVHGFARFLLELLEQERPRHIAVAFDEALDSCFRNQLYPAYKANRDPAPDELKRQFTHCKALCAALGLNVLAHGEYEADDLIGSALHAARPRGFRGVIVSADKDMSQLLMESDEQWDFARGQRWGMAGVKARHGVEARQIADYLALTGDAVDNIRGVRGIGPKTAAALLGHFASIDALYANLDAVGRLKIRAAPALPEKLRQHRGNVDVALQLTRVRYDAPVFDDADALLRRPPDLEGLGDLYDVAGFGESLRRQARRLAAG